MISLFGFLVLAVVTIVLWVAAGRIHAVSRRVELLVLFAIVYFWTFAGAWLFLLDSISDFNGYRIGLSYYYLMEKMFPFVVDGNYLLSLIYYAFFALVLCGLFYFGRRRVELITPSTSVPISAAALILVTCGSMLMSYLGAREAVELGLSGDMSFYEAKQQLAPSAAKIFELSNSVMVMSLFIGLVAVFPSGPDGSWMKADTKGWLRPVFLILLALVLLYLTLLGDRSSLFTGFLWATIYLYQVHGSRSLRRIILLVGICLLVMLPGSALRGVVFTSAPAVTETEEPFSLDMIQHVPRRAENKFQRLGNLILSNEMFAAHFSLYGCLSQNVDISPGISLRYFAGRLTGDSIASSNTSYTHYATGVGAEEGQGYTIHHATAWYLNTGVAGFPIAALALFGVFVMVVWVGRMFRNTPILSLVTAVLPISMVSYLPALIRAGPEAYKALLMEGLGIPAFVLLVSALSYTLFKREQR